MRRFHLVGRCAGLLAAAQVKNPVFPTGQSLRAYSPLGFLRKRGLFQACIVNLSEATIEARAPTAGIPESLHGNAVGTASVAEEVVRKVAEEEVNRTILKENSNAAIVRSVESVLEHNVVESSESNIASVAQGKVAAGMLDEENDEDEEDDEELTSESDEESSMELNDDEQFDTESDEELNLSAAEALAQEFSARNTSVPELSDDELASKDEITSSRKKKKSYLHKLTIQEVSEVLEKLRPIDLKILNVQERCEWTDHMVFVTGRSARHIRGMADSIVEAVKKKSTLNMHSKFPTVEGRDSEDWMVVDCANIIIHVFSEEARARYNLEAKWGGTEEIEEVADDEEEEGEDNEDEDEDEGAENLETR